VKYRLVFLLLASPFTTLADNTSGDCLSFRSESHPAYQFVNPQGKEGIQKWRDRTCNYMIDELGWTHEEAAAFMDAILRRYGYCYDNTLNADFLHYLNEYEAPRSLISVYEKFCLDTFDPTNRIVMAFRLIERAHWLRVERFCQVTRYIAHPDTWLNIFRPDDKRSLNRLERQSDSLCKKFRDNQIPYDEALYRWNQEWIRFKEHVGPEILRDIGKGPKRPIEGLMKLLESSD
jgi:hypothetical protein